MSRSVARFFVFVIVIALLKSSGYSQATAETGNAVSPETIKALTQRLQDLESQVADLKAELSKVTAKTDSTANSAPLLAAVPPAAEPAPMQSMSMSSPMDNHTSTPKMQLRGYADVGWNTTDQKGVNDSFALGQFNFFITSRLTDRAHVLSETVVEADESTNEFGIDLERLELIYSVNDHLDLQFGRFHTAMGFYNTAYHHSAVMQTTLNRPFLFDFEDDGGILPVHSVGMSATGTVSNKLGLHYIAEIGNGRNTRKDVDPVQNVVDNNNGKAFNLGFFVRPSAVPGLQFGVSNYHDHITPQGFANVTEDITVAHVVYQNTRFEFLNEAALLRHATQGTNLVTNTPGFYSQISRRFGDYRPYFRYEYLNVPASDPLYSDVGLLHGPKLGVRYDINDFSAFKVEYGRNWRRNLVPVNTLGTQLSFEF